jgi:tetratricopeptide (TPR) repeat protein
MKLFAHLEHICQGPAKGLAPYVQKHKETTRAERSRSRRGVQGVNAFKFIMMAGCLFFGLATQAAGVSGAIQFQGDTVHLELSGLQNWDYDVKRVDNKGKPVVQMSVPALDDSTIQKLNAFKSDYVTGVSVDRKGPDGKNIISFTLANEGIDSFDYLTDQPSRLIMDFYVNPSAKSAPVAKVEKNETLPTKLPAKIAKSDTKAQTGKLAKGRKPATADVLTIANQGTAVAINEASNTVRSGIFDGGDPGYDRFAIKDYEVKEDAIIRARDNYYIPFPMMESPMTYWDKMKVTPALYEIAPQPTEENKQARLLLTLFEKQRYAVFLKTQKWFKEKYPKSQYNEIIDYMTADVHLALWQDEKRTASYDEAMQLYKEAVKEYPKSPLAERTSLKIGYLTLERGDYLGALRAFNEHVENKNFPDQNSISKDLARIGSGLAFMKLNRSVEAIEQFENVEKNSPNRDLKVEASFRKGDVWVRNKNYPKAVESYEASLKKYPEAADTYPNAFYNQAESLFWMNKYNKSLDVYRDFVKKFPSNENAAYAMTRMGELLEIFGADTSRVMGAYLETYFRYGESPNAVVARLRLLSTRMTAMKPKEVKSAVDEIMSLAKKVDLPNIEQFATVMVADGYTRRKEYQKSVDLLSKYYKENPTSVDVPLLTNRIVSNINEKLQSEVESGNFIQGLRTHSQYADTWLKNSKRLDTKFYVGRAFELGGAPAEAEKYYKDVLNRTYAIRGTPEAKEIQIKQDVPSEDEMNLRLANVFTQEQKFNQAYEHLKNIKTPEKLPDTSQIERVNIAVKLLEKRGDNESAIRYLGELLKTWKGQPELVAEPYLKLAELQLKQGRTPEAMQALEMVDQLQTDSGKVAPAIHAKALELMGETHLAKGENEQAIAAYEKLLGKYEETRPLSSIRYKLGQIYFKRGEPKKAAEAWSDFKGEKSEFWKNLAQEQLKNSNWRDDYKKYIKRIPAMSENENGK